jgi:hypothetical protein
MVPPYQAHSPEDVLADLGLTMADWERMAKTPLDQPLSQEENPGKLKSA